MELIGEIGTNHNGSFQEAVNIIDLAKKAGLDTVKFQIYHAQDIVSPKVKSSYYGLKTEHEYWTDYINNKLITPIEWLKELIPYCSEVKIDTLATVHSIQGAEQCLKLGVNRLKIASMDCNHFSFLGDLSHLQVPILLSTGMADTDEIRTAVEIFQSADIDLTLFHCTATYPTKYEEANLNFYNFLKSLKPNRLGLSDHSENSDLALMSLPYGISVIEKHITSDKSQIGPDHNFALDYTGMLELKTKINQGLSALGDGNKIFSKRELDNRNKYRRKPILNKGKKTGELLNYNDIYFARADFEYADTISLNETSKYIGSKFINDVEAENVLRSSFFN